MKIIKRNIFQTVNVVRYSLISLYIALTIPIPFYTIDELKLISILIFILGLLSIINITNDYVITNSKSISFKTKFPSNILGKKSWEINWKDIKLIKSFSTSQGSKVHYFITNKEKSFLIPQRIVHFDKFISIIANETNLNTSELSYIAPLWTYKLLTFLSLSMILGEVLAFSI